MNATSLRHPGEATRVALLDGASLVRGAAGGIGAGILFGAANMWFAASHGGPVKMPLMMMIASLVQGGEAAVRDGTANPVLGAAVHMMLSAVFGVIFTILVARLRSNGLVAVAGTVFGAVLYLVNFVVIAPLTAPVFRAANQPFELWST